MKEYNKSRNHFKKFNKERQKSFIFVVEILLFMLGEIKNTIKNLQKKFIFWKSPKSFMLKSFKLKMIKIIVVTKIFMFRKTALGFVDEHQDTH